MKTCLAIFTASVLFVFTSCNNNQQTAATEESRGEAAAPSQSAVMKTAYQGIVQAFETGNTDNLGNYVTENTVDHGEPMPGITSAGLQRLKDIIAMYRTAFSNIKMDYHHVAVDGDMLIAHGSWSGNNTGAFMGMPATNKPVNNVGFVDILRFENGKAAEHWEVGDMISMMTQLGVMPPQGPAPAAMQNPTYDWNAQASSDPASIEGMKKAYNSVIAMIQAGDLSQVDQYVADNMAEHMQMPGAALPPGLEGAKQVMAMFKQAYPDLKITVSHLAAEGDVLIAHTMVEGTFSGNFQGIPATAKGKQVKFADVDIVKFNAEGKATDHWEVGDHYTELVQLGVIPAPDGNAQASAAH